MRLSNIKCPADFLFQGHQGVPAFLLGGVRQIVFAKKMDDRFFIKPQVRVNAALFIQGGIGCVPGAAGIPEKIDIFIPGFQMTGERQSIQDIVVAGINHRFTGQVHQPFDGKEENIHVAGKTVAHGSVEKRVPGNEKTPGMKADGIVCMSGSSVDQDAFCVDNKRLMVLEISRANEFGACFLQQMVVSRGMVVVRMRVGDDFQHEIVLLQKIKYFFPCAPVDGHGLRFSVQKV